ncbi:O-antigen ligase [Marinomonas fungiae]|uniref:O-antigen ligase n=2 Tax=Marinomonas fungiae TaxID=1137284 RepID=A0A0K6II98_9GAMM|nr:O-antigen ligase [Marinomonas fungiae]
MGRGTLNSTNSSLYRYFSYFVWLLAAATLALTLSIPRGISYPTLCLFFLAIIFSIVFIKRSLSLTRQDALLIIVFALYGLSSIGFVYLDGWHVRELDRPSRFLLVLPVLILLLKSKMPNVPILFYGSILGAIAAALLAAHEVFVLGLPRAQVYSNAIMFGDTSMLLGLLNAVACFYFYHNKQKLMVYLAALAFCCGVLGSILSGSRGGWIAVPLIGLFILIQAKDLIGKKQLISILMALSVAAVAAIAIPQTGMQTRIAKAYEDIELYQQGKTFTSVGLRFEMWKGAFYLFSQAPILGVGEYGSKPLKADLARKGLMSKAATRFDHLHNEFFNTLAIKGLLGLVFLIALYLVPLKLFLSKLRQHHSNWNIKAYALCGALVPMSYMDFALTQSMFSHNIGIMVFIFFIVFFWCAVRWAEELNK